MDEGDRETTSEETATTGPGELEPWHEPGLSERLAEGRRTFQPGLWLRLAIGGAVTLYLVLFIGLNTHKVKVSFVFGSTRVSLIWMILLAGGLGIVLGVLLSQLHRFRGRRSASRKQERSPKSSS